MCVPWKYNTPHDHTILCFRSRKKPKCKGLFLVAPPSCYVSRYTKETNGRGEETSRPPPCFLTADSNSLLGFCRLPEMLGGERLRGVFPLFPLPSYFISPVARFEWGVTGPVVARRYVCNGFCKPGPRIHAGRGGKTGILLCYQKSIINPGFPLRVSR